MKNQSSERKPFSSQKAAGKRSLRQSPQRDKHQTLLENNEIFDLSSLKKMSSSKPVFFIEMMDIYLRDVPIAINKLEVLFQQKKWIKIGRIAHKLKSNFMVVGMNKAVDLSLTLEFDMQEGNVFPEEVIKQIKYLRNITEYTYPIFEQEIQTYKST